MQLQKFHLGLVAHPRILVCTRPNCGYGLALMPSVKERVAHVKQSHSYTLIDAQLATLKLLLQEQKLENSRLIKSKSAVKGHIKQHTSAGGASTYHCNDAVGNDAVGNDAVQLYCTAESADKLDDAAKAKVSALIKMDQELLHRAGLLAPQIQPSGRTRAGKTATAIGLLHGEPNKWRGAHRYGAHWIYVASKRCAAAWMSGLLTSSRKTQTNFHAHGPDASEPYSLSKGTV
ncbi:uncharacterized protein UMAG_12318 [Mycosarcoma maydis]|uniref:Uncharacterized protein n=1 Tax=Mycosarcoma maydis TaxID=5270 RepID=A0A0D1BVW6_MYCMD|nr:uncharacterized protein UMAG_12318 [Ustilago maydis 521]KIS66147.1 hypothetical protein UMAG_12318 [Ustilago maydis 521]|eukprot:XP_011392356.1 hypothetical protein UMAG_12318 [Ustilago maydis 521]